jgi:hypothetical protein
MFNEMISLVAGRILGLRELVGVINMGQYELIAPAQVYMGDYYYTDKMLYSVFGFSSEGNLEFAFGNAFGIFGMLFLGGSYLTLFFGTLLFSISVMIVEEIYIRAGYKDASIVISVVIGMWVWWGINVLIHFNFILSSLVFLLLLRNIRLQTQENVA